MHIENWREIPVDAHRHELLGQRPPEPTCKLNRTRTAQSLHARPGRERRTGQTAYGTSLLIDGDEKGQIALILDVTYEISNLLVQFFLERHVRKARKEVPGMDAGALELLTQAEFRGNVRQLEAAVERAVTLVEPGETIGVDHLPEDLRGELTAGPLPEFPSAEMDEPDSPLSGDRRQGRLKRAMERWEAKLVREALAQHGGRQTTTARYLGISRMALINKMKKYSLR